MRFGPRPSQKGAGQGVVVAPLRVAGCHGRPGRGRCSAESRLACPSATTSTASLSLSLSRLRKSREFCSSRHQHFKMVRPDYPCSPTRRTGRRIGGNKDRRTDGKCVCFRRIGYCKGFASQALGIRCPTGSVPKEEKVRVGSSTRHDQVGSQEDSRSPGSRWKPQAPSDAIGLW